jgi:LacI family transcriptional regulator
MHKRVTQKDIAQRLNISQSLVAGILANRPNVWASEETRRRILEAAREMNYQPNRAAQSLRSGKTGSVCLVCHCTGTAQSRLNVVMTMEELIGALGKYGYELRLRVDHDAERLCDNLRQVAQENYADAYVLLGGEEDVEAHAQILAEAGVPFVLRGRFERCYPDWLQIDLDHEEIMRIAVRTALENGRQRLAYIGSDNAEYATLRLLEGFLNAVREERRNGAKIESVLTASVGATPTLAKQKMDEWWQLSTSARPDAIIIGSDSQAWRGVERSILFHGKRVGIDPDDILLIGMTGQNPDPLLDGMGLGFCVNDAAYRLISSVLVEQILLPLLKGVTLEQCVYRVVPPLEPVTSTNEPFVRFLIEQYRESQRGNPVSLRNTTTT